MPHRSRGRVAARTEPQQIGKRRRGSHFPFSLLFPTIRIHTKKRHGRRVVVLLHSAAARRMRVRACWQSRSRSAARNWPSCVLCGLRRRPSQSATRSRHHPRFCRPHPRSGSHARDRRHGATCLHAQGRRATYLIGDESEPGDGDATTATTRMRQPPPAPLGRSGNEHAANLPHDGDHAMEGGGAAARHAAERAAAGTEDRAAGRARARAACELAAVRTWAVRSASLTRRQHEQTTRRWAKWVHKESPEPQWQTQTRKGLPRVRSTQAPATPRGVAWTPATILLFLKRRPPRSEVLMIWSPKAPARQQQGEVATARTPPPHARVPRMAQQRSSGRQRRRNRS